MVIVEVMIIMIAKALKYLFSLKILMLVQLTVMTIVVANIKDAMMNVLEKAAAFVDVELVLFCSLVIVVVMTFVAEVAPCLYPACPIAPSPPSLPSLSIVMSLVVEAHCVIVIVMIALMWIADGVRMVCYSWKQY